MNYAMTPAGLVGPGTVLGKFTLVRQLGLGGMCVVYEARHEELQKTVAVKTLRPEFAHQPAVVERFLREGKAASRVRHRHAIDMIDVGTHEGVVYLAMEYLEGEDLAQRLRRDGAIPTQAAVDLLLPAMAAVVEAHDAGVVHRDLKPANVFLARSRRGHVEPKVLDFGISKLPDDGQGQTATDTVLGTPYFMAPEQVRSARLTGPASDQYALGVILYQCVTGRLPFVGETAFATFEKVVRGEFVRPRALAPAVPEGVEAAIVRAMALDPAARFGSVAELGEALLPFASAGTRDLWATTFTAAPSPAADGALGPSPDGSLGGTLADAPREIAAPAASQASSRPRRGLLAVVGAFAVVGLLAGLAGRLTRPQRAETARPAAPSPTAARVDTPAIQARPAPPVTPTRAAVPESDAGTPTASPMVAGATPPPAARIAPSAAPPVLAAHATREPATANDARARGRDRRTGSAASSGRGRASGVQLTTGAGTPGRDSTGTLDIQ